MTQTTAGGPNVAEASHEKALKVCIRLVVHSNFMNARRKYVEFMVGFSRTI